MPDNLLKRPVAHRMPLADWDELMDLIHTGLIPPGSRVCFVHTGGLSSLFQYEEEFNAHLNALS